MTNCGPSAWAGTTTSPSPTTSRCCWPGSRRSCAAPGGPAEPDVLEAKGLILHLARGTAEAEGKVAELTRNELKILAYLMSHAGQIVSRADLIDALWDSRIYIDDNTLSVNMTRLRGKLAEIGLPDVIKTRRGMGYQL